MQAKVIFSSNNINNAHINEFKKPSIIRYKNTEDGIARWIGYAFNSRKLSKQNDISYIYGRVSYI